MIVVMRLSELVLAISMLDVILALDGALDF
jgi:hypothetical protein